MSPILPVSTIIPIFFPIEENRGAFTDLHSPMETKKSVQHLQELNAFRFNIRLWILDIPTHDAMPVFLNLFLQKTFHISQERP